MFGSGRKEEPKAVGARQKIEQARKHSSRFQVQSKREGRPPNPKLAIVIVWVMAVGLATLLTESPVQNIEMFRTGHAGFDTLMFGTSTPTFTGTQDIDYLILLAVRGTVIFFAAGIIPIVTFLWQSLFDRTHMNVYASFWGVTIVLAAACLLSRGFISQLLN
jgi:hypothetical protein